MSDRYVTIGNQQLRLDIRAGQADRPPLLLFGGIGASFEVLQPLVDAIDPGIEIIRIDVPGIGGSPAAALPYSFRQLARTMARVLDKLGAGQVDVLGYSWGGALAQQFALQFGARCRKLVLISTSSGYLSVPGDPRVLSKMLTPRYIGDPQEAVFLVDQLHRQPPARTVGGRFRRTPVTAGTRGYLHQLSALGAWTSLPFLPLIRQPVLVLSGDDDLIVPVANARLLARLIPHSKLQIFPGGHLEIINAADSLGRSVTKFLAAE